MKKNGQYVGVDEKYIPDDEKYVDNNLNNEVKDDFSNIYKGAKGYISDKDNQEKMKTVGKKGLKIVKGVGIAYLCFFGFVILMAVVIFIIVFSNFSKINNKQSNEINNTASETINSDYDVSSFNSDFEIYNGTKYGTQVSKLLDNVNTKIKTETNHSITVVYGSISTSNTDEITNLKKEFDSSKKYEISFDYDSNGYIYKVTITAY